MKKSKYIANIAFICLLIISSIVMYLCYSPIHGAVNNSINNEHAISDYADYHLEQYNYLIDLKLKNIDANTSNLSQYVIKNNTSNDYVFNNEQSFYSDIYHAKDYFQTQSDFLYYAIDNETGHVIKNTEDNLSLIQTDSDIRSQYQWYIQYTFDTSGALSIAFASSSYVPLENNVGISVSQSYYYDGDEGTLSVNNPKNVTITYAVQNTIPDGLLKTHVEGYYSSNYLSYTLFYVFLISATVFIAILITPYKFLEKIKLLEVFAKIKFEFLSTIWCTLAFFMLRLSPEVIFITTSHQLITFLEEYGAKAFQDILSRTFNIGYFLCFFFLIAFFAYMIRYLFHKGLKNYFFENTCFGWIIHHSSKIIEKIINFDLNDNINKAVLKIVLFNFVIITIISIFFVFGIFFSFVYSIIIFVLLKQKFIHIQDDYHTLLNATRQLSNGNFKAHINEDVGLFNPLKDEFTHIKDGFEKAVNEEVKSQKMKTELISNVSHDLKTPLTAMITYVDLLKNNQLSQEERDNYLQIIERNSLRLKNLIDDLFEVSKANSGNVKLDLIEVDIVSLIKQAQLECQDKFEEKHLDVRIEYNDDKIICLLDSSKAYRIFENLFINISKYALSNTRVYINIIEDESTVTIIFKNISEAEMTFNENDIVERFVQGDQSRNTSGSGLGLAIVKSFTELQNGQFYIELDGDLFKSILKFNKKTR